MSRRPDLAAVSKQRRRDTNAVQVQRSTGFAPGLFTGAEMDAKAIQVYSHERWYASSVPNSLALQSRLMQDKEGKVSYLQKIIDYVSTSLSEPVAAKPAKVPKFPRPSPANFTQSFLLYSIVESNMLQCCRLRLV